MSKRHESLWLFFFVLFKKASDNIIYFKTDTDYLYVAFIIYSYFHLKKKTKTKRLINQKFITNKLIEEVKREKTLWLAALFCKLLAEFLLFFVIVFFFYSIYIYMFEMNWIQTYLWQCNKAYFWNYIFELLLVFSCVMLSYQTSSSSFEIWYVRNVIIL